jgi:hydroxymethylbilane synthase
MDKLIKIGTRESQLAVWQATHVQQLLSKNGYQSELIYIKTEGDLDLQTPLYEMGVQGIAGISCVSHRGDCHRYFKHDEP